MQEAASAPSADSSLSSTPEGARLAPITIDYPEEGSIFPPEMTAPTFLWRDAAESTEVWLIEVAFADGSAGVRVKSRGERFRIGEIDARCIAPMNELPKPTQEEAAAHTWKPEAATWEAIKKHSVEHPAAITITGFQDQHPEHPVSRGAVVIQTSRDPVGAPIFYRDVPLMPSELQKGVIKPLAQSALPLLAWRLRNIAEPRSRLLLTDLHTCANCHSFSLDGKTLGMDIDGPANDKGLYAIATVKPQMSIRNEHVISWSSLRDEGAPQSRVGFMSQVSPDGQFVVTTLTGLDKKSESSYYVANFTDYHFLQVFYPTRGILAWYSRATGRRQALPGADDPRYVHTDAVWSPDGKYLVFALAEAKDPYPEGRKLAEHANDPEETQIQYDLYRIPFNGGKGGRPEPIIGASRNGMSNTFPKVSPDGRWIVFVQCRNGQLMRPDSQLYIVPVAGGQARRMRCNTPLMNSWHSFSPNGRWLVFSSKSRGPYTQMFLTYLDEDGNDSPAILIDNATAANRAVNIPEFVNIPPDGLLKIEVPAAEIYRLIDRGLDLAKKGQGDAAIAEWEKALELDPGDAKVHYCLGVALGQKGKRDEAITHFQKAVEVNPEYAQAQNNLGLALGQKGRLDEAITHFQKAVEVDPELAEAQDNLGLALGKKGRLDEAITHFQKAVEVNPELAEAQNNLGLALGMKGRLDEAITHFQKAVEVNPELAEAQNNLGLALGKKGRLDEAITHFQKAVEVNPELAHAQYNLGSALRQEERLDEAITHFQKAVEVDPEFADAQDNLGLALGQKGRLDEAITHFQKAVEVNPEFADAQNNLGSALRQKGRLDEAITHFQKAVEVNPEFAHAQNNLGSALMQKGRLEEALTHFQKAVEVNPEFAEAQYNLGVALGQEGRLDEAITHFQKAVEVNPEFADAQDSLGVALGQKGRLDEAITHFQRAQELNPRNARADFNLAYALYSQGRISEALAYWRRGLRTEPDTLPVLNQVAWLLATCPKASDRNGAEAVELAARAVQLSNGRDPAVLYTLAAAYAEVGRFPEAAQTARRAVALATQQNRQPLVEALKAALALYEAKTPFREVHEPSLSLPPPR
jgi:tetratricopeptide (TPR) repeat protein